MSGAGTDFKGAFMREVVSYNLFVFSKKKYLQKTIIQSLREKWPNTKFFLVRIFLSSD